MNPMLLISGINAALSLLEQFTPELRALVNEGKVSKEQEAIVLARIDLIRSGKFFESPQWQIAPDPTPSPAASPGHVATVTAPVNVIAPP